MRAKAAPNEPTKRIVEGEKVIRKRLEINLVCTIGGRGPRFAVAAALATASAEQRAESIRVMA